MSIEDIFDLTFSQFILLLNQIHNLIALDEAVRGPYSPWVDHKKHKPPDIPSFYLDKPDVSISEWREAAKKAGLKFPE